MQVLTENITHFIGGEIQGLISVYNYYQEIPVNYPKLIEFFL